MPKTRRKNEIEQVNVTRLKQQQNIVPEEEQFMDFQDHYRL